MSARHVDVIVRDWPDGTVPGGLKAGRSGYWRARTADGRSVDRRLFTTMDQASDAVRPVEEKKRLGLLIRTKETGDLRRRGGPACGRFVVVPR